MKCQSLFSGKNKKNIMSLSSAELAQRVVKINDFVYPFTPSNGSVLLTSSHKY